MCWAPPRRSSNAAKVHISPVIRSAPRRDPEDRFVVNAPVNYTPLAVVNHLVNYRNGRNTLGASTSYEKPQRIEGVIVPRTLRISGLLTEFWILQS